LRQYFISLGIITKFVSFTSLDHRNDNIPRNGFDIEFINQEDIISTMISDIWDNAMSNQQDTIVIVTDNIKYSRTVNKLMNKGFEVVIVSSELTYISQIASKLVIIDDIPLSKKEIAQKEKLQTSCPQRGKKEKGKEKQKEQEPTTSQSNENVQAVPNSSSVQKTLQIATEKVPTVVAEKVSENYSPNSTDKKKNKKKKANSIKLR